MRRKHYRNLWRALLLERVGPQSRQFDPSQSIILQDLCLVNIRFSPRRQFLSTAAAAHVTTGGKPRQAATLRKELEKKLQYQPTLRIEELGSWLQKLVVSNATNHDIQAIRSILQHPTALLPLTKLSSQNVSVLYRLLSKFNCLDLLKQVRTALTDMGVQPTVSDYEIWLITYTKSNMMKQAQKLISDAQKEGVELSWNRALAACIDNGDLESAHQAIKVLAAELPHIQIEALLYKNLISAYLSPGHRKDSASLGAAIRTFQLMIQTDIEADGETYSAFIEAYMEDSLANWKDREHETRVSTIDRLYEAVLAQPNFEPPSSFWASLIHFYTKNGTLSKAEQIYHDFKRSELVSSEVMSVTEDLIVGLAKRRLMVSANSLFYELLADGHLFSPKTLSVLVYGYGRQNDLEAAEQLINISRDQWITDSLQPYAALIRENVRLDNVGAGRRIFDNIADRLPLADTRLQVYIHNLLLTGYAGAGDVKQCETLWRRMNDHDIVSYNIMLEAYSTTELWGDFVNVLDQMHQSKIELDNRTKSILIFAQIRQGQLDQAQALVHQYASRETLQHGLPNLSGAVDSLLQLQSLQGNKEACKQLFQYLEKHSQVSSNSYQSLMFCLGKIGATSELKDVHEKALKIGHKVEPAIDRIIRRWLK
ncbi:unnamed protein product [Umbelopsis vinacea]